MNTKLSSKLFVVGLLLSAFTAAEEGFAQAGSNFANAIAISSGDTTGTLPGPSPVLSWFYKFAVDAGQDIVLSLEGPDGTNFGLTLYDPAENIVVFTLSGAYPKILSRLSVTSGGTWYVEVVPSVGIGSGEFTLTLNLVTRAGTGPGSGFVQAIELTPGSTTGSLPGSAADGSIYYKFQANESQTIGLSLIGATGSDFNLFLYNSEQDLVASSVLSNYPDVVSYPDTIAGVYYAQVALNSGFGDFILFLETTEYSGPGSSAEEAFPITPGAFKSELPGPSPKNGIWYFFELAERQDIYLELDTSEEAGNFGLSLYGPDQELLSLASGNDFLKTLAYLNAPAGIYFVEIVPFSGTGLFILTLTLVSPAERLPGTNFETVIEIGPGETTGVLPGPSENKGLLYAFSVKDAEAIFLSLNGPTASNFELTLYGPDHNYLAASPGGGYPETLEYLAQKGGLYFVEVIPLKGEGTFQLSLSLELKATTTTPIAPPITTTTPIAPPITTTPMTTTETSSLPEFTLGSEVFSMLLALLFFLWFYRCRHHN